MPSAISEPPRSSDRAAHGGDQQAAILLENVTVSYGAFVALKHLTLSVRQGELLSVLGPSGSGKTTLLNLVAGSVYPNAGRIRFGDRDVTHVPSHQRRVGMVFQRYTLFPNRNVAENVAFPLEIRKIDQATQRKLVAGALDLVGLRHLADRYPSQISGGQAQRAALARAVVFDPSIMLMDEPLGALDRVLRKTLQYEIRALQQRLRVPMLYVTHDQEEAMSLSDRIAIVRDGEIVASGAPRALYQNPGTVWTANFLGDANCLPTSGLVKPGWAQIDATIAVPVATMANVDGPARILIRPEDCKVSREPAVAWMKQSAAVEWVEFLGPFQRVRMRIFNCSVTAQVPGRAPSFAAGDTVYLSWNAEDAVLIQDR